MSINGFTKEKEILEKLVTVSELVHELRYQVSDMILRKSEVLGINMTKELQEKCERVIEEKTQKTFKCKICHKVFNEGRKLGGHVSRAHKGDPKLLESSYLDDDEEDYHQTIVSHKKKTIRHVPTVSVKPPQRKGLRSRKPSPSLLDFRTEDIYIEES